MLPIALFFSKAPVTEVYFRHKNLVREVHLHEVF